ncbi:MAG: ParB/RepB/Spo0J family partition protein [Reyranella sp.]|uniref:ParB/RepB/Spo0J family partition protein n=1 Tax=Reyranella sp. TaxID=1929291 RepID=UPI00272EFA39|nr:ParB/RepB/Spo0J family partition protein [Reyranella sp.]MDP1963461.1 ParB/RepB/Spo0J family partition protein [Reyranella sp.]MDP2376929.1 ParB/RepB/Spo0J family partition protein [Reyranella sp.]
MSQPPKPRGLGRGLSALLGDDEVAATVAPSPPPPLPDYPSPEVQHTYAPNRPPLTLPIGQLKPGKMQPRTSFEGIETLVESVKEFGLLQPILVRPLRDASDTYEIIAGERRWRAAQRAQLHEVPVVIRSIGDMDALQLGLIENLQRADLTPIDEAQGYRRLMEDFTQTQDDLAKTMGKSRPHIANTLRLLDLPPSVQEMIRAGQLSAGQGRTLLGLADPALMAARAVEEKLSVRELERLAGAEKKQGKAKAGKAPSATPKSADTRALEKRIEEALGLKADLKLRGIGEQTLLTLEIRNFDQLDTVVERLTRR